MSKPRANIKKLALGISAAMARRKEFKFKPHGEGIRGVYFTESSIVTRNVCDFCRQSADGSIEHDSDCAGVQMLLALDELKEYRNGLH